MKTCPACNRTMPLSSFKPQRLGKHGVTARCRSCINEKARKVYVDKKTRSEAKRLREGVA